jgi:tetratricopeptide (TPR) repeat protein
MYEEAISEYRQSLAIAPRNPGIEDRLGQLLYQHGHPDEAVATMTEAVRRTPDDALLRDHLGLALEASGRPAEAVGAVRSGHPPQTRLSGKPIYAWGTCSPAWDAPPKPTSTSRKLFSITWSRSRLRMRRIASGTDDRFASSVFVLVKKKQATQPDGLFH